MIAGKPIINAVTPSGNMVRLPINNSSYFDQLTAHKTLLLAAGKQAWFSIVSNRSQTTQPSSPAQLYQKIQFSLSPTTTVLGDLQNIAVTDNLVVTPYQRGAAPQ